jgi:hypothetical protein
MMNLSRWCAAVCLLAVGAIPRAAAQVVSLKPVSAFSPINDEHARSIALFVEASRVITSPRCMNCHPANRQPTQGDGLHAHVPLMQGGPQDRGTPGLPCVSCHGAVNTLTLASSIGSLPGNSQWRLAPASMAWQGRSLREICLQLKDGARNGGRSLAKIREHMERDRLVGWAWNPGEGRAPAPGTQAQFGALIQAWISTGAQCPQP